MQIQLNSDKPYSGDFGDHGTVAARPGETITVDPYVGQVLMRTGNWTQLDETSGVREQPNPEPQFPTPQELAAQQSKDVNPSGQKAPEDTDEDDSDETDASTGAKKAKAKRR